MAFVPTGLAPTGHEPEGHHPGGAASTSTVDKTAATNPGGAASVLNLYASTFRVDEPTNSNSETDSGGRYNICQRTGFKVLPGELLQEWNGLLVRPESFEARHPQDFVRSKAERQTGPQNPEPDDTFISTSVSAESL
jgi:hypothetical protein